MVEESVLEVVVLRAVSLVLGGGGIANLGKPRSGRVQEAAQP
jgi:hypothetical protein